MDEDDIVIELRLDDREIDRQIMELERKLNAALDAAGVGAGVPCGVGADTGTRIFKDRQPVKTEDGRRHTDRGKA